MLPSRLTTLPTPPAWSLLLVGSVAVGLLATVAPLVALALPALLLVGLGALYLLARPWTLFGLYLFALAPHVLFMALLLDKVGLPAAAVKGISAWKEGTLLLLLAYAGWRLLHARGRATLPDLFAGLYVVVNVLDLGFSLLRGSPMSLLLYGLRDHLLPVLLYAAGRAIPFGEARARTIFRWILGASLLYSVIGFIEWRFFSVTLHVDLGIARYYRELLGIDYGSYYQGLPPNYWRSTGGGLVRRAASVFGSSQSFALSYLLFLPASIYGLFATRLREHRLSIVVFALSMLGLWITITRFTILVGIGLIVLGGLIMSARARQLVWRGLGVMAVGLLLTILLSETTRSLFLEAVTFREHSAANRFGIWAQTLRVVAEQPLGYGIGAVGQTAARFVDARFILVGIEGQFSKIAVELGVPGLFSYLVFLLGTAAFLFASYQRVHVPYTRGLFFMTFLTIMGLIANALTTEWHNSVALVYPAFWLAGSCVTTALMRRRAASDGEA